VESGYYEKTKKRHARRQTSKNFDHAGGDFARLYETEARGVLGSQDEEALQLPMGDKGLVGDLDCRALSYHEHGFAVESGV